MERLIREVLEEEGGSLPLPADSWQRQERLLVDAGLVGDQSGRPLRGGLQRRTPWGRAALEVGLVAAVLIGAVLLASWRTTSPVHGTASTGKEPGRTNLPATEPRIEPTPIEPANLEPPKGVPATTGPVASQTAGYPLYTQAHPLATSEFVRVEIGVGASSGVVQNDHPARIAMIEKLTHWLNQAERRGEGSQAEPADSMPHQAVSLYRGDGSSIWVQLMVGKCTTGLKPDCSKLIVGDGRGRSSEIMEQDLWRYMAGRLYDADRRDQAMPIWNTQGPWEGNIRLTKAEALAQITADPDVASTGLQVGAAQGPSLGFTQRKDADGLWRVDAVPVWTAHLRSLDPKIEYGQIVYLNDATGRILGRVKGVLFRGNP